jgi:hypothetical protein
VLAEAIAGGLLPGERAVLHERAARALAATGEERLAGEVAGHWQAAEGFAFLDRGWTLARVADDGLGQRSGLADLHDQARRDALVRAARQARRAQRQHATHRATALLAALTRRASRPGPAPESL